jgi:hypothetical protein
VAWLASLACEVRSSDDGRLKRFSDDGGDSFDPQFEAVDAVFDELLVAASVE